MTAPNVRSSVEGVLGNHEKRIGILEAVNPSATAASLPSAWASGATQNVSNAGGLNIPFDTIAWNDDTVFGYSTARTGTPGPAGVKNSDYVTINKEGWWIGRFQVSWDTDWTAGDLPFIDVYTLNSGSEDPVANIAVEWWNDEQNGIYGTQYNGDIGTGHMSLYSFMAFNFSAAAWGETTPGIGMRIRSSFARTKLYFGNMTITWVGDMLVDQTIV